MVTSLDGRSTKWETTSQKDWASKEDQEHFSSLLQEYSLIIMGRKTYDAAKYAMKHTSGRLRIVLTRNPEQHKSEQIPGMLEFSNESPTHLIKRLSQDFDQALLVSGADVNSAFFEVNLVDELWLTVEPKLFGMGNGIVKHERYDIPLQLLSIEKMNPTGTLLLRYRVLKKTTLHNT